MNLFVVGVNEQPGPAFSNGVAKMYIWAVTNLDPIKMTHGGRLSAIEVFRFQEKILTGGENGEIKLWDGIDSVVPPAEPNVVKIFNGSSSNGNKVRALLWIINTQYFVSAHQNMKVNVWRMDAEFEDLVDTETYANIPNFLGFVENPNYPVFTIGFSGGSNAVTLRSEAINCHKFCKTCAGPGEYQCLTCFSGFGITPNYYCKIICPVGQYHVSSTNTCANCNPTPGCSSCIGPRSVDCNSCSGGFLIHPDNECATACRQGTYQKLATNLCLACHPTCKECDGPSNLDCLSCIPGALFNIDGTCFPKCKPGSFQNNSTHCEKCHPSCKDCNSGLDSSCTSCFNETRNILNKRNQCIDCLDEFSKDPATCYFTKSIELVRCPYESKDPFSSLTLKIWFDEIDKLEETFKTKMNWA